MTTWHEPQAPAPAPPPNPGPGRVTDPAGAARDADHAAPAGTSEQDRAAQRQQWQRAQASHGRGQRGGRHRRRAARGTLPGPGMIRRPPPDGGNAA